MRPRLIIFTIAVLSLLTQSCTLIDDDLSKCPVNNQTFQLNYEMRLVTNMDIELDLVLSAVSDTAVKRLVRQDLSSIFSDHAHDVDLSFFRTFDDERSYYRNEIINGNRSSFTFYLPKESYRHLALANIKDALTVNKTDSLNREYLSLTSISGDTIPSQTTGLFSARLDMEVQDSIDQQFDVHLYMVNSSMVLVIDTTGCTVGDIRVFTVGTGCGFFVNDSVFDYSRKPIVRANPIKTANTPHLPSNIKAAKAENTTVKLAAFTSVNFPSDTELTEDGYWQVYVYVNNEDGTITENVLKVYSPLRAGELRVLRAQLDNKGQLTPVSTSEVGVAVTLDWKNGDEHEINF